MRADFGDQPSQVLFSLFNIVHHAFKLTGSFLVCSLFTLVTPCRGETPSIAPPTTGSSGTIEPGSLALRTQLPATPYPVGAVRLLDDGPFAAAVKANRTYLLALDPDRLVAPFRREAGLPAKAKNYGNWESSGLDGHTAGHYLSALSYMIAAGQDTSDHRLLLRLRYLLAELELCQEKFGNGYLGGIPAGNKLWAEIDKGDPTAVARWWAPWYNLHKTFAGLRDAYMQTGDVRARAMFLKFCDWTIALTAHLSDEVMQKMLEQEYGGMNEVLADAFAMTGDVKYLRTALRFNHEALFAPLAKGSDELTGKHANTQIPKVIGLARIAELTKDPNAEKAARFFWDTVTENRSVVFGGNSVSEHFNDPKDFQGLLQHREGPETCNTYNMLKLTEQLFAAEPNGHYADYYERALYNHLLASIDPETPGYVYFTPIRPEHYRVYSVPEVGFWCCVGTGMENPGKYGEFIYSKAQDGLFVNLFIGSELKDPALGLQLRQETQFPKEEGTRLLFTVQAPKTFALHLRKPAWVPGTSLQVKINGVEQTVAASASSYITLLREWNTGDKVEIALPMHTSVEGLPDKSSWYAILHGPIVLVHPAGTSEMTGLRADDSRMAHVASGPEYPLEHAPVLLSAPQTIAAHVLPDATKGVLHFRLTEIVFPQKSEGLELVPFYSLHNSRYQMYWETTTPAGLARRNEELAAAEKQRIAREAATLDWVEPGMQQPEVEHQFSGEETATGLHNGRHWRHGKRLEYTLHTRGQKAVVLSVTYSGDDADRVFEIKANGVLIATERLKAEKRGGFIERRYTIPSEITAGAASDALRIQFHAENGLAGGLYDVRLLRLPMPE